MTSLLKAFDQVEYVHLDWHFRVDPPVLLAERFELMLRSQVHRVALDVLAPDRYESLFTPQVPADPTAVRRYQRPAPPFALQPLAGRENSSISNRQVTLTMHLFGDGILRLGDLAAVFTVLAETGLQHEKGRGKLVTVEARDASGAVVQLCDPRRNPVCSDPPRITATWRFDNEARSDSWRIVLKTPTRLVSKGRPLFRPTLRHLLPFVLRRVTSMLYYWCGQEIDNAAELLMVAECLQETGSELRWEDWRSLDGDVESGNLGGVTGIFRLQGPVPDELLALLRLGSLMNIGKGAAWGAGNYRIEPG